MGRYDADAGARLAVANAVGLQFGWRLLEPMLCSATAFDEMMDD
jgi:TetR/AcrR family transcriptional regulator, repressor for neighboring sulfatase